jgi:hypothetical protein
MDAKTDWVVELQKVYDSEIHVEMSWFWDGGIDVRLGDRMNGFLAEENVGSMAEIIPWLQEAIAHFYPESEYVVSLSRDQGTRINEALSDPQGPIRPNPPRVTQTNRAPLYTVVCTKHTKNVLELVGRKKGRMRRNYGGALKWI